MKEFKESSPISSSLSPSSKTKNLIIYLNLVKFLESDQIIRPSTSPIVQETDLDHLPDDFLTFIEQKTSGMTIAPELNPFANEFSFVNHKTPVKGALITNNDIDHDVIDENQSSYRLLFDNLIQKSLESIEAIKECRK